MNYESEETTHLFGPSQNKPDRPVIEEDSTDKDWALFVNIWG